MRSLLRISLVLGALALLASAALAEPFTSDSKNLTINRTEMADPEARGLLDCTMNVEATLGDFFTMSNAGFPSNVSTYPCWSWTMSGPEVVFHVYLADPVYWQVTLTTYTADVDMMILEANCDEVDCVYAIDSGAVYTTAPLSGDFFFVVDGYNGAEGDFDIFFEELPPPPSACDELMQAFPGDTGDPVPEGTYSLSGDTCDAYDHITSLECAEYSEAGLDEFYEIYLLPGASINATVTNTADGALWVVDACENFEDVNCLAYADATLSGDPETVYYMNTNPDPQTVFLVVDAYGTDSCGTFTGQIELTPPGALPTEETSWSSMKALYK